MDDDGVAHRDPSVVEDVGVEPGPVDQLLDDPWPCQLLQVQARLAQLHPKALDLTDPKAPADQIVQSHAAHHHLPARRGAGEGDALQHFRLDQGERLTGRGALLVEVAVALEPLAGEGAGRLDRRDRLGGTDVDLLDVHGSIMSAANGRVQRNTRAAGQAKDRCQYQLGVQC
jgi:hypothetical protein